MKKILMFIFVAVISNNISAKPQKPIPICANINKLAAYKIATELVDMCSNAGVNVNFTRVQNYMLKDVNKEKPFSCNSACWLMSGKTDMASCVENVQVDPFVNSFMESVHGYGATSVCAKVKGW